MSHHEHLREHFGPGRPASLDEQEELSNTLRRRVAEKRREELISAVKEARAERAMSKFKAASPSAIMKMIKAGNGRC